MFAPMSRSHDFISHTLYTHFTQIASRFLVQTLYCLKDICPSGKIIKKVANYKRLHCFSKLCILKTFPMQNLSNMKYVEYAPGLVLN